MTVLRFRPLGEEIRPPFSYTGSHLHVGCISKLCFRKSIPVGSKSIPCACVFRPCPCVVVHIAPLSITGEPGALRDFCKLCLHLIECSCAVFNWNLVTKGLREERFSVVSFSWLSRPAASYVWTMLLFLVLTRGEIGKSSVFRALGPVFTRCAQGAFQSALTNDSALRHPPYELGALSQSPLLIRRV